MIKPWHRLLAPEKIHRNSSTTSKNNKLHDHAPEFIRMSHGPSTLECTPIYPCKIIQPFGSSLAACQMSRCPADNFPLAFIAPSFDFAIPSSTGILYIKKWQNDC